MATRSLNVVITGDSKDFSRALKGVDKDTVHAEGRLKRFSGAAKAAFAGLGLAAATGMAAVGKATVKTASDIEESLTKNQQLFGRHAEGIDKWSKSTARSMGISRAAALEATGTFGNLFTALDIGPGKSAKMSKSLVQLAGDLASFNNASPEEAMEAIRSGLVGETEPLRKFGVNLNDATLRTEALRIGLVKTTKDALDPQTKALAVNSLLFKQTEKAQGDFQRTSGGLANQQRILSAQLKDLGGQIGAVLLPVVLKITKALVNLGPVFRGVGKWFGDLRDSFKGGSGDASRFANSIRDRFQMVIGFFRDLGRNIARTFRGSGEDFKTIGRALLTFMRVTSEVVNEVAKRILPILRRAIEGLAEVVRGVVKVVASVLRGDFKGAWEGAKLIVRGALKAIVATILGLHKVLSEAMVALAKAMIRGLVAGLKGLAGAIKNAVVDGVKKGVGAAAGAVSDIVGKINPFGDGIGKAARSIAGDGLGFLGGSAGASGAGLMGADFDLAPFARIGASFGLRTTSGLRPGAVTSYGNPSYHGSGDAIDMAGPPGAMRRFAATMASMFGPRLRELIYTPLGFSIKDGRRTAPLAASDHFDHVHVAYTGPFGDGIGQAASAARAAGFRGNDLLTAIAIAGPESGYRNSARLVSPVEDSRGMWQINTLAHPWARGLNLSDPNVAARAARRVWREAGGFGPWTAFSSGTYRDYLDDARQVLSGGGSAGGGRGGSPRQTSARARFEASQRRTSGRSRSRIAQRPGARVGPSNSFGFRGSFGQSKPVPWWEQPLPESEGGDAPTFVDLLDRDAALAALTEDTGDDLDVAKKREQFWRDRLWDAMQTADPRDDTEAATQLKAAIDAVASLEDAISGQTRIAEERLALDKELAVNQKQLLKLAGQGDQIVAAVVAAVNGAIGGRVGLGFQSPGYAGGTARY